MTDSRQKRAPVLIPAGEPLLSAAAWVGTACWAELTLHQILTDHLAEASTQQSPNPEALWVVRAHRAELAEAWHRRLPELSEFPRSGFVVAGDVGARLVDDRDPAAILARLLDHYRARVAVAVGPADGPVADTLAVAIARTEQDLERWV